MSEMNNEVHSTVSENDTKLNKKKKRSLFRTATRLYLALALAALVGTFGWFTINTLVFVQNETAGNIQITVSSGDLYIAQNLEDFSSVGYAERAQAMSIVRESSTYIDISGNGEKLYYPKSLSIDSATNTDYADLSSTNNFSEVSGDSSFYVEVRVYFRTTAEMDVYLGKDSYVKSLETNLINSGNVSSFARQSIFGSFSCDGIIGASRVAFLESDMAEENETLTLKTVWIPNDDVMLSYTDSTKSAANLSLNVSAANRESRTGYHYLQESGNIMVENTYTADDYATGKVLVTTMNGGETVLADPNTKMVNQAVPLLEFTNPGTTQTKLLVIRLWFEGTDREADQALNGGMAKYNLSFFGSDKSDYAYNLASQAAIDTASAAEEGYRNLLNNYLGVYYNTVQGKLCIYQSDNYNTNTSQAVDIPMLYSLNGLEWMSYTPSAAETIWQRGTTDKYVYVRLAETADLKPGNVVKLRIPALTS